MRRPSIGRPLVGALVLAFGLALVGCTPRPVGGDLPPTLSMRDVAGGTIAVQDGLPVPSFSYQPEHRIDLSGVWRVQRRDLNADASLTDRSDSMGPIVADAGGRQETDFDDATWTSVAVPGSFNPPPDRTQGGAWYRQRFFVPVGWQDEAVTLKFGAVNYVADVWLNGTYLGYHEGGYTPFAFDATPAIKTGQTNVIAVRVDNPTWGTRTDIVPWGLTDWWNYGGITQPVWLEAAPRLHIARVDVTPHLDGADMSIVVENRGQPQPRSSLRVDVLPAHVDPSNIANPDPRSLLPPAVPPVISQRLGETQPPGSQAFGSAEIPVPALAAGGAAVVSTSFLFGDPDMWRPSRPALYVARATLTAEDGSADVSLETFGVRRIAVDTAAPRLLLNGVPAAFDGVAVHDDSASTTAVLASGPAGSNGADPASVAAAAIRAQADRVLAVHATLVRAGHTPANPTLLMLADRLGFGIWEEIPLYHYTPLTFGIAMNRGIPQQMLREMALRDMNHPSVLFHGLANESTGTNERTAALQTLRDVDRAIDGTRLTGQASYGFDPSDPTSDPLDVVGYTSYYGVFYGTDATAGTQAALAAAHRRYPTKPIMILEFGRWADPPDGVAAQQRVFTEMKNVIDPLRDTADGGYVGSALWWSLEDYHTLRPGLDIERFGLYDASGTRRPVASVAEAAWNITAATSPTAGSGSASGGVAANVPGRTIQVGAGNRQLLLYLGYAVAISLGGLALPLLVLVGLNRVQHRPRPDRGPA